MNIGRYIFTALASALLAASCAKSGSEDWEPIEQESLDLWMKYHRAEGLADGTIEYLEEGMYIEWLKPRQTNPGVEDQIETGVWLNLSYRGTDLNGNVFVTLYEEEARRQGTFIEYAHYIPHFMEYSAFSTVTNAYTQLTEGEFLALSHMSLGDSVRVYLPSKLAYLSTGKSFYSTSNYRYPGSLLTVPGNTPVIIDLYVEEIVQDPEARERELVRAVAKEWGLDLDKDALNSDFYLERLDEDLTAEVVLADSSVYIEFTGRFLDGFLYQTNVDAIATAEWKSTSTYSPKVFHNRSSYTSSDYLSPPVVEMFSKALDTNGLRYNSLYRIVFTSGYGYGTTEQAPTTSRAVVYPFTPFMYEIRTMEKGYNTSDDDDEDE